MPLLPDTSGVEIAQDNHRALVYKAKDGEVTGMLAGRVENELDFLANTAWRRYVSWCRAAVREDGEKMEIWVE
jgi:hypothetical protein